MLSLPWYYKVLGAVVILAAVYGGGYYRGYSGEHDKFVSFEQSVKDEGTAQAVAARARDLANEQQKKESADEYQKNLDDTNARWSIRLRNTSACGGSMPQASGASGKPDGATQNPLPAYKQLVMDCAD